MNGHHTPPRIFPAGAPNAPLTRRLRLRKWWGAASGNMRGSVLIGGGYSHFRCDDRLYQGNRQQLATAADHRDPSGHHHFAAFAAVSSRSPLDTADQTPWLADHARIRQKRSC
jgi:hypothetical protein